MTHPMSPRDIFLLLVHAVCERRVADLPRLYAETTNVTHPFDPFGAPPLRTRSSGGRAQRHAHAMRSCEASDLVSALPQGRRRRSPAELRLNYACPTCTAPPRTYCRRPSGHAGSPGSMLGMHMPRYYLAVDASAICNCFDTRRKSAPRKPARRSMAMTGQR
jgi:hypothetical protein